MTRVLGAASPAIATVLRGILDEPIRDVSELREEVRSYLAKLRDLSGDLEFLDLALAQHLAVRCVALIDGLGPDSPPETQRLVQAAARYFVEDDDAEGDTISPIGFDDDAEVIELVAREIGREDVLDLQAPENT